MSLCLTPYCDMLFQCVWILNICVIRLWEWCYSSIILPHISYASQQAGDEFSDVIMCMICALFLVFYREPCHFQWLHFILGWLCQFNEGCPRVQFKDVWFIKGKKLMLLVDCKIFLIVLPFKMNQDFGSFAFFLLLQCWKLILVAYFIWHYH